MDTVVETLVEMAKEGDKEALEELVRKVQDLVYGLSLRMLANPFDAEDAAQEILVKVITHLDSFRGESKFTSWVYRIASNHLLTIKKSRAENRLSAFKDLENIVDRDLSELSEPLSASPLSSEQSLVSYEIMIGCSMAMLTCLNRDLRITFILAMFFEIKSDKAVYVFQFSSRVSREIHIETIISCINWSVAGLVLPAGCKRTGEIIFTVLIEKIQNNFFYFSIAFIHTLSPAAH